MILKILSFALLAIGAFLVYGAKKILEKSGKDTDDKSVVTVKSIGLVIALAGAIIIFVVK